MDAFETFARAGMELRGETVDDTDIAVMRAADAAYGPPIRALMEEPLDQVKPEADLDPARAPRS
ncbi:MAG TPA: hypothetical protein VF520_05705 [Thermoleophilaceae bacterium]|jgi:hypothetical protein